MWKHELVQAIIALNIWMKFHRNPCENRVVRAMTRICSHWSIFSNSILDLEGTMLKHELVEANITFNLWMKFHRNPCKDTLFRAMTRISWNWSIFSNSDLNLEGRMPKHELVQAIITLQRWMKFHRNPCENRVVRAMTRIMHGRTDGRTEGRTDGRTDGRCPI